MIATFRPSATNRLNAAKAFFAVIGISVVSVCPTHAQQFLSYEFGNPTFEDLTEINQTGLLNLFDSDLGTLTGATLTLFGSMRTTFTVTSNAVTDAQFTGEVKSDLFFSSNIMGLNSLLSQPSSVLSLEYLTGLNSIAPDQTLTFGPVLESDSMVFDLSAYLWDLQSAGGGSFEITGVSLSSQSIIGGGGVLTVDFSTLAGVGARIDYTYLPIPEPASALLVCLAGCFALVGNRRRQQP